jgi:hypothetical protein
MSTNSVTVSDISKSTLKAMEEFFLNTSIPRILSEMEVKQNDRSRN